MGPCKYENNKQMITLTVSTISGFMKCRGNNCSNGLIEKMFGEQIVFELTFCEQAKKLHLPLPIKF